MAVISSIIAGIAAIATATSAFAAVNGALAATFFAIGAYGSFFAVWGGIIYGGYALSKALSGSKKTSGLDSSPTYASPVQQTQTNNQLPVPIFYGERTLAGNNIWIDGTTTIKRIVGFCEGPIESISNIKLNDIPIEEIAGASYTVYLGTPDQEIDSRVLGINQAERAETVGSLKYVAYVALTYQQNDKVDRNANLTAFVKGRKIRIYTTEDTYTTAYTRNPVWSCFDLLTSYNGAGIGLKNDGTRDEALIKEIFDIPSFIEAAEYCDAVIRYYTLTTSLSGSNNNLLFRARKAGDNGITIKYTNPAIPNRPASISVVNNKININLATNASSQITTKANDIISLINNNSDALALIQVYKADNNDGTGIVTPLQETSLIAGNGSARFLYDLIYDSELSTRDAVEEIKKNCRGCLTVKGQKLQFKIDKPGTPVKVITPQDIIKGSEQFYTKPREEHYDILEVKYVSKDHEYSKVAARAELAVYQCEPGIEHEVDINSITVFEQAARQAWYYLNDKRLCPYFGSFETDFRAFDLEIGDVITLSDNLMGFTNYNVKVTKVVDDHTGVFKVFWRTYNEGLYTDELGSIEPSIVLTNLTDPYAYPDDVLNFQASKSQSLVQFNWQEVSGSSLTYEIREGESWNQSSTIATGLTGSSYATPLISAGIHKYWIKAKNKYGNVSENAKLSILSIDKLDALNIILSKDILLDIKGSFDNTYYYRGDLKLKPNIKWENISPQKWDFTGYYSDNNKWGTTVCDNGTYTSQVFSLNTVLESIVSFNIDFDRPDDISNVILEWKYSEDNITWTDWKLASAGSYKFKFYQLRITINSPANKQCIVTKCVINIDVPDILQDKVISVPAQKTTFNFDKNFNIDPSQITMAVSIFNAHEGDTVIFSNISQSSFDIEIKNSGVNVARTVHIFAKGY